MIDKLLWHWNMNLVIPLHIIFCLHSTMVHNFRTKFAVILCSEKGHLAAGRTVLSLISIWAIFEAVSVLQMAFQLSNWSVSMISDFFSSKWAHFGNSTALSWWLWVWGVPDIFEPATSYAPYLYFILCTFLCWFQICI